MPENERVSLFDLWLELHPISDEFRRSLAVSDAALFKAYKDRTKQQEISCVDEQGSNTVAPV